MKLINENCQQFYVYTFIESGFSDYSEAIYLSPIEITEDSLAQAKTEYDRIEKHINDSLKMIYEKYKQVSIPRNAPKKERLRLAEKNAENRRYWEESMKTVDRNIGWEEFLVKHYGLIRPELTDLNIE